MVGKSAVPGVPGKEEHHPILLLLKVLFLAALLAASGINWYIVYLLARDTTDFARVRKFAGIAGGFLFTLFILIIVAVIVLFFTGGEALLFRKGLVSAQGFVAFTFFIFIIVVAGIDFAIMPIAKGLIDVDPVEANQDPAKSKMTKLAIAGAGFGTGIIALALFYYAIRGYFASKKTKTTTVTSVPGLSPGGVSPTVSPGGLGKRGQEIEMSPVTPVPVNNGAAAAAEARKQLEIQRAAEH